MAQKQGTGQPTLGVKADVNSQNSNCNPEKVSWEALQTRRKPGENPETVKAMQINELISLFS